LIWALRCDLLKPEWSKANEAIYRKNVNVGPACRAVFKRAADLRAAELDERFYKRNRADA
jgi:hypothetical protein